MEAFLLGSEASDCMNVDDPSNSLFNMPLVSSLPEPINPKIHSKIKCPGCMNDADVDADFAKVENDQGILSKHVELMCCIMQKFVGMKSNLFDYTL